MGWLSVDQSGLDIPQAILSFKPFTGDVAGVEMFAFCGRFQWHGLISFNSDTLNNGGDSLADTDAHGA